ncbi:MAG TPA: hypothetical protein VKB88_15800 [Bryobacteraceae bacterium]|nr:hypothetical protein [Bryobacteraceae bacterium]
MTIDQTKCRAGYRGMFKSKDADATWSPINNGLDELTQVGCDLARQSGLS